MNSRDTGFEASAGAALWHGGFSAAWLAFPRIHADAPVLAAVGRRDADARKAFQRLGGAECLGFTVGQAVPLARFLNNQFVDDHVGLLFCLGADGLNAARYFLKIESLTKQP